MDKVELRARERIVDRSGLTDESVSLRATESLRATQLPHVD